MELRGLDFYAVVRSGFGDNGTMGSGINPHDAIMGI